MAFLQVPNNDEGSMLDEYLNQLPPQHDFDLFDSSDRNLEDDDFLMLPSKLQNFDFGIASFESFFAARSHSFDSPSQIYDTQQDCSRLQCVDGVPCPACMQRMLDDFEDCSKPSNYCSAITSQATSATISRTTSGSHLASTGACTPSVVSTTTSYKRRKRIEGGYPCPETSCDKTFDRKCDLNHHARTHQSTANRPHGCEDCEQRFHYPKDLRRHRERLHPDTTKPNTARFKVASRPRSPLSASTTKPAKRKRISPPSRPDSVNGPGSARLNTPDDVLTSMPEMQSRLPLPDVGRPPGPPTKETAQRYLEAIRNLLSHHPQEALRYEIEMSLDFIALRLKSLHVDDV